MARTIDIAAVKSNLKAAKADLKAATKVAKAACKTEERLVNLVGKLSSKLEAANQ